MKMKFKTAILALAGILILVLLSGCSFTTSDSNGEVPLPGEYMIETDDSYPIKTVPLSNVKYMDCDEMYVLSIDNEAVSEYPATKYKDWIYVFNPYGVSNSELFIVPKPSFGTFALYSYPYDQSQKSGYGLYAGNYYTEIWKLASMSSEDNPVVFITTDRMEYAIVNGTAYYFDGVIWTGWHVSLPEFDLSEYETEVICIKRSSESNLKW